MIYFLFNSHEIWVSTQENLSSGFVNSTGADQPAHPGSLIRAFVIRFWESIICKLATGEISGAQWLSGRVLDWRPKGCGFESHQRHCVVVLEQDTFILA